MNEKDRERAILNAYYAWVRTPADKYRQRVETWERYVALRDGKAPPPPTNHRGMTEVETDFREVEFETPLRPRRLMQ